MNEKPTKRQKTGGRRAGTPNRATASVREAAQEYTTDALNTLVAVMNDDTQPGAARVAAANSVLDRGHGKPSQPIETSIEVHQMDLSAINKELEEAARVRAERRAQLESEGRIGRFQTP